MSEPVESGDVLVASPDDDGTAVRRWTCDGDCSPVVGLALEPSPDDVGLPVEVSTLVGGQGVDTESRDDEAGDADSDLRSEVELLREENESLRAELDRKDERIATLEDRLAAVESHVGLGDAGSGPTLADD